MVGARVKRCGQVGMGVENFHEVGEGCAHLDSQCHLSHQVSCAWPYKRCPKYQPILSIGNEHGDAIITAQGQGAAIGSEGETSNAYRIASLRGLFGSVADRGNLWRSMHNQRGHQGRELDTLAGCYLGRYFGLFDGNARQGTSARAIPNSIDMRYAALLHMVDGDAAIFHALNISSIEMQTGRVRSNSLGDNQRTISGFFGVCFGDDLDAQLAQTGLDQAQRGGIKASQDLLTWNQQFDLYIQAGQQSFQLHGNIVISKYPQFCK